MTFSTIHTYITTTCDAVTRPSGSRRSQYNDSLYMRGEHLYVYLIDYIRNKLDEVSKVRFTVLKSIRVYERILSIMYRTLCLFHFLEGYKQPACRRNSSIL